MTMTEEQKKMVDKVTKLLTLAEGTNHSQEAETARRMAIELMAKYNISLSNRVDKESNGIVDQQLDIYNSHEHYYHLINAVAKFNDVFVIIVQKSTGQKLLRYIGKESSLSTFDYMRDIVEKQRNTAWILHSANPRFSHETYCEQKRNQWYLGYAYGVMSKVMELLQSRDAKIHEWGLVPVSQIKKAEQWYKEKTNAKIRNSSSSNNQYLQSGYRSGRDVSLNRAVNNGGGTGTSKALN